MYRWPVLSDFVGFELLEVAAAMEDGSYWDTPNDGDARDYGGGFDPHGDGG
jgi:hypothetical protein